ncbi:ribosome-recycling factor chloroplastic-like, partial [Trifolium pratense]
MATSFSQTTPLRSIFQPPQNISKPILLSLSESSSYSFKRSSTYVTLKLPRSLTLSKGLSTLQRRKRIVRAATIEEIEAEKSAIETNVKSRMESTLENVRTNFGSIRTGRATPSMLDKIETMAFHKAIASPSCTSSCGHLHPVKADIKFPSAF